MIGIWCYINLNLPNAGPELFGFFQPVSALYFWLSVFCVTEIPYQACRVLLTSDQVAFPLPVFTVRSFGPVCY